MYGYLVMNGIWRENKGILREIYKRYDNNDLWDGNKNNVETQ